MHPGIAAGVAFATAYEIENFSAAAVEFTPAPTSGATMGALKRGAMRPANRLFGAFYRRLPALLRRPAAP